MNFVTSGRSSMPAGQANPIGRVRKLKVIERAPYLWHWMPMSSAE